MSRPRFPVSVWSFALINHVTGSMLTRLNIFRGKTIRAANLQGLVREMRVVPTAQPLIRVGLDKDGGYLLHDDLDGVGYCFSPGVADCSDFQLDLANCGMQKFLADQSVDKPPQRIPGFALSRSTLPRSVFRRAA